MEFEFDTELAGAPLDDLRRKLSDLTDLHDEVGMYLVSSTQQRFEDGQAPNGSYWLPSGRSKEDGGQPLTDRGHLRDSITYESGRAGAEVGSNMIYAAVHQFGALIMPKEPGGYLVFRAGDGFVKVKSVVIEARPYLGLNSEDERVIREIAEEYMAEPLRGNA
jgi:phage virion morphogenesis protein